MKIYISSISVQSLLMVLFITVAARSQGEVTITYGNLDGSPLTAQVGERIYLDVWMVTDETVWGGSTAISISCQNRYIDSLLSQTEGIVYFPLNQWPVAYFVDPLYDPDPDGWSYEVFVGAWGGSEYLLHFLEPQRVMTMVFKAVDDPSIAGDSADCFGAGRHPFYGPSNMGDTLGIGFYPITEIYSPIQFEPLVGVDERPNTTPAEFELSQNYPNPFNASTIIKYELPYQSQVTIEVYDILGRKIATLQNGLQLAGYHQAIWRAEDVASGVYFCKLQAGDYVETKKMILVK